MRKRLPIIAGFLTFILGMILLRMTAPEARCRDGWRSPSIGRQGACSHHGGVRRSGHGLLVYPLIALSIYVGGRTHGILFPPQPPRALPPVPPREKEMPLPGEPACPKCGAAMRKRLARRGKYRGTWFLGCTEYPRCRGLRKLPNPGD